MAVRTLRKQLYYYSTGLLVCQALFLYIQEDSEYFSVQKKLKKFQKIFRPLQALNFLCFQQYVHKM